MTLKRWRIHANCTTGLFLADRGYLRWLSATLQQVCQVSRRAMRRRFACRGSWIYPQRQAPEMTNFVHF